MKDASRNSWTVRRLDEVAQVGAGNPAPQDKRLFEGGQYPFIRTSDVGKVRFGEIGSAVDHLNDEGISGLRLVPAGTILLPKSGASTFLNHRVITLRDAYVSSHLATVTAKPDLADPRYLLYALSRVSAQELLPENSYPSLNLSLIKSIKLPIPALEEQRRIVAVLDEAFEGLARARSHAEANLQNAQELFPSLLDEVFARDDWPELELQDLAHENCSLSYGIVQPGDDVEDGLPIVRPVDLDRDEIGLEGLKRINPERASSYSRTQLDGSELLLCVRGTTGTISLASDELSGANVTRGIVPIRFNDQMHRLFGFYQFRSRQLQHQIAEKTYGAALMQINIRDVKKLRLRCPPISEQIAAVERMDGIGTAHHELLSAAKTKLGDLEDLRQSLLQKAFSGELT